MHSAGKEENTVQIHLALLATKTKRPVKMVWNVREESGVAGMKRHPMIVTTKTAADRDGRILANQVRIVADTGAYASLGPTVLDVGCGKFLRAIPRSEHRYRCLLSLYE